MKNFKSYSKKMSGITMIALVITIIILLILVGVTVATLTGENGILTKAQQARENTEQAEVEEQLRLAQLSAKIKAEGENVTLDNYLEELERQEIDYEVTEGENQTTNITINGKYVYEITEVDSVK